MSDDRFGGGFVAGLTFTLIGGTIIWVILSINAKENEMLDNKLKETKNLEARLEHMLEKLEKQK